MRPLPIFVRAMILLVALPGLCGFWGCGEDSRPNVIVIVLDSMRADHLGRSGYERDTTPFLDRLAAEGVYFETAYSTAPWTKPSVASLLTGLYPESHGLVHEFGAGSSLADELTTLPELLAGEGYQTHAHIANPLLSAQFGFDQGFDTYKVYSEWIDQCTEPLTKEAILGLDRLGGRKPFFYYMHYLDPHGAYQPPKLYKEWVEGIAPPKRPALKAGQDMILSGEKKRRPDEDPPALPTPADLGEDGVAWLLALYDSEIRHLDSMIETLWEEMGNRGLLDNTIVIVTADHGEEFLDHGLLRHGFQLYEESVRIPLILWGSVIPAELRGKTIAEPVEIVDIPSTIAAIVGLPGEAGAGAGRNLLEPLGTERAVYGSTRYRGLDVRFVRQGDWKLIWDSARDRIELYRVGRDAAESENLAVSEREVVERLLKQVATRATGMPSPPPGAGEEVEVEGDLKKKLEALGYF